MKTKNKSKVEIALHTLNAKCKYCNRKQKETELLIYKRR